MAQRRVVAVGAMCPAMLLRHPVAAGGLWWSVLNDCVKNEKCHHFCVAAEYHEKMPPLTEYHDKIVLWTLATMTNIVMPHGIP